MYICVLKLSVSPNFWKRIGWMRIPTNPSFPQRQLGSILRDFPFRNFFLRMAAPDADPLANEESRIKSNGSKFWTFVGPLGLDY